MFRHNGQGTVGIVCGHGTATMRFAIAPRAAPSRWRGPRASSARSRRWGTAGPTRTARCASPSCATTGAARPARCCASRRPTARWRSSWPATATPTSCAPRSRASSRWTPTLRPSRPCWPRDPVAADAAADLAGLRPVLFPTPYEAAAWAVLSARQQLRAGGGDPRAAGGGAGRVAGRSTAASCARSRRRATSSQVRQIGGGQALERLRRLHAVAEAALLGRARPRRPARGPGGRGAPPA